MEYSKSKSTHFVALVEYKESSTDAPQIKPAGNGNWSFSTVTKSPVLTFDADINGPVMPDTLQRLQEHLVSIRDDISKCIILSWQRYEAGKEENMKEKTA